MFKQTKVATQKSSLAGLLTTAKRPLEKKHPALQSISVIKQSQPAT